MHLHLWRLRMSWSGCEDELKKREGARRELLKSDCFSFSSGLGLQQGIDKTCLILLQRFVNAAWLKCTFSCPELLVTLWRRWQLTLSLFACFHLSTFRYLCFCMFLLTDIQVQRRSLPVLSRRLHIESSELNWSIWWYNEVQLASWWQKASIHPGTRTMPGPAVETACLYVFMLTVELCHCFGCLCVYVCLSLSFFF